MVGKWLKSFVEIGRLLKRLDIGEGDYMKELEEDYDVADSVNQVTVISLSNEQRCEAFKGQFQKFDYLWTKDLQVGRSPPTRIIMIPHLSNSTPFPTPDPPRCSSQVYMFTLYVLPATFPPPLPSGDAA